MQNPRVTVDYSLKFCEMSRHGEQASIRRIRYNQDPFTPTRARNNEPKVFKVQEPELIPHRLLETNPMIGSAQALSWNTVLTQEPFLIVVRVCQGLAFR